MQFFIYENILDCSYLAHSDKLVAEIPELREQLTRACDQLTAEVELRRKAEGDCKDLAQSLEQLERKTETGQKTLVEGQKRFAEQTQELDLANNKIVELKELVKTLTAKVTVCKCSKFVTVIKLG